MHHSLCNELRLETGERRVDAECRKCRYKRRNLGRFVKARDVQLRVHTRHKAVERFVTIFTRTRVECRLRSDIIFANSKIEVFHHHITNNIVVKQQQMYITSANINVRWIVQSGVDRQLDALLSSADHIHALDYSWICG